jgi:hypothetical protein
MPNKPERPTVAVSPGVAGPCRLQECHLMGSVRLGAMITVARNGQTVRPRPSGQLR